jgi:hypothetical protein
MKTDNNFDILIIARMSPVLNSRTRNLISALSTNFKIRVISENLSALELGMKCLDGVRLDLFSLPFTWLRIRYLAGLLRVIYFNLLASWAALTSHASIIVCSDSIYILAGVVSKIFLRRKFVYNAHEIAWALGNPLMLSWLMGWLEKLAIQTCDFWLVPSEERAAIILKKHNVIKAYVVYYNFPFVNEVVSDITAMKIETLFRRLCIKKPIVMFQGSITQDRGLEQLIQAAKSGSFHFIIQGEGVFAGELRHMANENVTFLDACTNSEAITWLRKADLSFIYYENNCLNSAYACSSKFFVSVFAGVPVVCNRLPAFQSFAEQYGGIAFFDSLSQEAIDKCVKNALDYLHYSELKREMTEAAKILGAIPFKQRLCQAFSELFEMR